MIAILCSDLHLCHKAPIARSDEVDWYGAMQRSLNQLGDLAEKYLAPIVCAGDIFDSWRCPVELVNFALRALPPMYAVPGQHDLPYHSWNEVWKSPYHTLVEAGKVTTLNSVGRYVSGSNLFLYGFGWNCPIQKPDDEEDKNVLRLAVIHSYICTKETAYQGASKMFYSNRYAEYLRGYDAAVFGDNHKGFVTKVGKCNVMNCGTFMRRKSDESHYRPQVGLLYADGSIVPHYLSTSGEILLTKNQIRAGAVVPNMEQFLQELSILGDGALDFYDAVHRFMDEHNLDEQTIGFLLEALGR